MQKLFKTLRLSLLITLFTTLLFGMGESQNTQEDFRSIPKNQAINVQKGKNKDFCPVCGMTLHQFHKTNFAATSNGVESQYCSLVCLVEDEMENKKKITNIRVIDNNTMKFIDAKKAFYVVGSSKPATMSMVSIYGFGTSESAKKFMEENGGNIQNFEEIYKTLKTTQAKDMEATRQRQSKASKNGEMIYEKMCKKTDEKFKSISDAKTFLNESKICGTLDDKKLQVVAIYLTLKK